MVQLVTVKKSCSNAPIVLNICDDLKDIQIAATHALQVRHKFDTSYTKVWMRYCSDTYEQYFTHFFNLKCMRTRGNMDMLRIFILSLPV